MKHLLTCLLASLMLAMGSASMDTSSLNLAGECADASGLCPLKTSTIQLLDSDPSIVNATSAMMEFAKASDEDVRVVDEALAMGRSTPLGTNFYFKAHKLVVPPGNWVLYAPERLVYIEASEIELQGSLTIDVSGLDGPPTVPYPASNGASFGDAGKNGAAGSHGTNAGSITINAINITATGSGKLFLTANGGRGSIGQMGGRGYPGRDGEPGPTNPHCGRGGRGGDGQDGGWGGRSGAGGHGGAGGNVTVMAKSASGGLVVVTAAGGAGGNCTEGGKGAPGGRGGSGGPDRYKKCRKLLGIFVGQCRCVYGGNQGERGKDGRHGKDGEPGEAGITGNQGSYSIGEM